MGKLYFKRNLVLFFSNKLKKIILYIYILQKILFFYKMTKKAYGLDKIGFTCPICPIDSCLFKQRHLLIVYMMQKFFTLSVGKHIKRGFLIERKKILYLES